MSNQFRPNPAQLRSMIVNANSTYNIWPRGQGKTNDLAFHMATKVHLFEGGCGAFVGITYKHLALYIIPEIKLALSRYHYFEDIHYVIGKRPPKELDYPKNHASPDDYSNIMTWYNGTIIYFVSQDKNISFRGPSIDFILLDELLILNKSKIESEVFPANRGNLTKFGHIPQHHGIHASSSKPIGTKDQWILEANEYYVLDKVNNEQIQKELVEYELLFIDSSDKNARIKLWEEIKKLQSNINWYPSKDGLFYNECRAWNNIENLGWKWLKNERRMMTTLKFKVEILNDTLNSVENAFYPTFNESHHVYYNSFDYHHLDPLLAIGKSNVQDCRWDADHDTNKPIKLGQDYGVNINFLLVAQRNLNDVKIIKEFFVEAPLWMRDVLFKFIEYYKYHKHKLIHYYYDHTGNNRQSNSQQLAIEAATILRKAGWIVELRTKGAAIDPDFKYNLIHKIFANTIEGQINVSINGNNCPNLITSIKLSPVIQGTKGLKKDKSSEDPRKGIPQEIATHASDTFDFIVVGESNNASASSFIDVIIR